MNNGSNVANFRHFLCMNFRTQHNAWKFNQKPAFIGGFVNLGRPQLGASIYK